MEVNRVLFKTIIDRYLLPLMPIAQEGEIEDVNDSKLQNQLVDKTVQVIRADETDYMVFSPRQVKPDFYYKAKLSCETDHVKTVKIILDNLLSVLSGFRISDEARSLYYLDALCQTSVTFGICNLLSANKEEAFLLANTIKALEEWSQRTYEGRKVPFGIVIDFSDRDYCEDKQDYLSFLKSKYSASFTDGVFSAILLNAYGQIVGHIALPTLNKEYIFVDKHLNGKQFSLTPTRFENFSKLCNKQRVGLIALSNGDILTIKRTELVYAKREGCWLAYGYSAFFRPCIDNMFLFELKGKNKSPKTFTERISKTIYQSILDASFAHSGACISIADFGHHGKTLRHILHNCLIDEDIESSPEFIKKVGKSKYYAMCAKQAVIRQLTHYSIKANNRRTTDLFGNLSNKLRVELLSMDGAVVLDRRGSIKAVGAILQISPGSEEGGRFAATRELSKFGVAFKVSEDGGITGLANEEVILKIG